MKKFFVALCFVLCAIPSVAQVYPPQLVGECPPASASGEVFMQYSEISGPISVPVPSWGYPGSFVLDDGWLTVSLGPLSTPVGRAVGSPMAGYATGKSFVLDPLNCNFVDMWVEGGVLYYEAWLVKDGVIEFHAGDFEVGHGNGVDFGIWHTVWQNQPGMPYNKKTGEAVD